MGFLLNRRIYITEEIGRGYFSLFLLCMVCTWGTCMLVGVHTQVYASGSESNVGCLPLPSLDCLKTQGSLTRPSRWAGQPALSISLSLLTNATGVTGTTVSILSFLHRFWGFKGKSCVVMLIEHSPAH